MSVIDVHDDETKDGVILYSGDAKIKISPRLLIYSIICIINTIILRPTIGRVLYYNLQTRARYFASHVHLSQTSLIKYPINITFMYNIS